LKPQPGTNLYFHSPGGSLLGGLALGAAIRDLHLNTIVGGDYEEQISSSDSRTIVKGSICASACAFAFLGGVRREVLDPKSYLVHQFFSELRISRESDTQKTVALLNSYVDRMGIRRELLDGVFRTEPEHLSYFTIRTLWDLQVYNNSITWALPPEIESAANMADNAWKLEFDDNETPVIKLKRTTLHKNGTVTCSLRRTNQSTLEFRLSVVWESAADLERRQEAFDLLTNRPEFNSPSLTSGPDTDQIMRTYFCASSTETGKTLQLCPVTVLEKRVPRHEWAKLDEKHWQFQLQVSEVEFTSLLETRPDILYFACGIPNYLVEYDFCETFQLAGDFWRLTRLLK